MADRKSLNRSHETDTVTCRDDSTVGIKREMCSEEAVLEVNRAVGPPERQDWPLLDDGKTLTLKSEGEIVKDASTNYENVSSKFDNEAFGMILKNDDIKIENDPPAELLNTESGPDSTSRVLLTLNDKPNVVVDSFFHRLIGNDSIYMPQDRVRGSLNDSSSVHESLGRASNVKSEDSMLSVYVTCGDGSTVEIKRELCREDEKTALDGSLEVQDWVLCQDKKISALKSDVEKIKSEGIDCRFDKGEVEGFDMVVRNEDIRFETDQPDELNTERGADKTASRVLLTLNDKPNVVVDSFWLRSSKPDNSESNIEKDSQSGPLPQTPCRHQHMPCLVALLNAPIKTFRVSVPQDRVCGSQALNDDSSLVQEVLGLASTSKPKDSHWSEYEIKKSKDFEIQSVNGACCKGKQQQIDVLDICDHVPSSSILLDTSKMSMSAPSDVDGEAASPDIFRYFTGPAPSPTLLVDTTKLSVPEASNRGGETATPDNSRDLTDHGPSSTVLVDTPKVSVAEACHRAEQTVTPHISQYFTDHGSSFRVFPETTKISDGEINSRHRNIFKKNRDRNDLDKVGASHNSRSEQYVCVISPKEFNSSSDLQGHLKVHNVKKTRNSNFGAEQMSQCAEDSCDGKNHSALVPMYDICFQEFSISTSSDLQALERVNSGGKSYMCDVCSKQFSRAWNLKMHQRVCSRSKPYKCDVCSMQFSMPSNLHVHQRVHSGSKPYKCDVCSKQFSTSFYLKTHRKVHSGNEPHKCGVCSKQFRTSSHLNRHQKVHSSCKPYQCGVCSKHFSQSSALKTHLRLHSGSKPYQCDVCSKQFATSSYLKRHQIVHSGSKPYKCDVCSKQFRTSSHLNKHQRVHSGCKPYKCNVCSKHFSQSSSLKTHLRLHSGSKPYKCDVCSKQFVASSYLKTHRKVHSGNEPHKCGVCSKQFRTSSHLNRHQKVHSSCKPYQCGVCSKHFSQSSALKTHLRLHSGSKPYQCDVCSKQFATSSYLKRHQIVHSGSKPYKCDVCSKQFRTSSNLNKHQRVHSGCKLTSVMSVLNTFPNHHLLRRT